MTMDKINLTDLIDIQTIQNLQNDAASVLGISMEISDENKIDTTEGLRSFSIPIIIEGQNVGYVSGRQLLHEPISEDRWKDIMDFLSHTVNLLFQTAYQNKKTLQLSSMMEKEAHMKSDFLANMSHEIRTPMNAVIGMAEMALREELPSAAREYIKQILASGNTLLAIINDILDFSKIESGKMDINLAEYEPFSIVKDIAGIIMTRIKDKKIEFIIDVAPDIPKQLMGDSIRIKQVIINLANNAVKFTKEGYVHLSIDYERKSDREIMLKVFVEDTGIGIREEDMDKLFQSFHQVDSKRNRNVEGTGLGLAISKQLITLMNGHIWLESEYEKGSRFSFEIPQIVIDSQPSIEVEKSDPKTVGVFCTNPYLEKHMTRMLEQLNVKCLTMTKREDLKLLLENSAEFLFIELSDNSYASITNDFIASHPSMTGVWISEFGDKLQPSQENIVTVTKPLYIMDLSKILAHEDLYSEDEHLEDSFEFIAPDAEILIVDDNEPNLMVAKGILAPLQMKIDTASGGRQAIEMISKKHYDLVFMDHMMPELDGIETTRIIRRLHEEYDSVPIIALTANVMEETRAMFLVEGMNDFVAKPIELKIMLSKLKQWLPSHKLQKIEGSGEHEKEKRERLRRISAEIEIPMLDVKSALMLAGNETLFWEIVREFAKTIPQKTSLIQQYLTEKNWKKYTIEVHALKSFAKQVGALELSDLAAKLEQAGNKNDINFILANNETMMEKYQAYEPILKQYLKGPAEADKPKKGYDRGKVQDILDNMREAIDNLDIDIMDQVAEELEEMTLPEEQKTCFTQLKDAIERLDVENCEKIAAEWRNILS